MAPEKVNKKMCDDGHFFVEVQGADFRKNIAGETWIYRTIYCQKCGEARELHVATWYAKKESKPGKKPQLVDDLL